MAIGLWDPGSYELVRFALLRGVAVIYLVAFTVALRQYRPLCGEDGLMPLDDYRERRSFRERPSLFYFVEGDRWVGALAAIGVVGSALALGGAPGLLDGWWAIAAHVGIWGLLWALYLSFTNAGQLFYGYGWESMLCETGLLCVFLGPPTVAAPAVVVWLFRWLLFRNMVGAGLIKIRGDDCWRDLTCLDYHYETQPMPNPASWYVHHAPSWLHRFGVATNHAVELALPFLYVAPQPVAGLAGVASIGFMGWLIVSGNFSWLNFLTAVQAFSLFDDDVIAAVLPVASRDFAPAPPAFQYATYALAVLIVALSYYPVRNMISSSQVMNTGFDPLNLVNSYGAFGSITKTRYEIVVEGTRDRDPETAEWEPYLFHGKPTATDRLPPQVAPYHHRLDWQMWFAAMRRSPRRSPWFVHMCAKLLLADEPTLTLLREDPFDGEPPRWIRATRYRYRYTTPEERAETGDWWHREPVATYYGPVSRDDLGLRRTLERMGWEETVEALEAAGEETGLGNEPLSDTEV